MSAPTPRNLEFDVVPASPVLAREEAGGPAIDAVRNMGRGVWNISGQQRVGQGCDSSPASKTAVSRAVRG